MLVINRGYGWLVPIIALFAFLVTQDVVDSYYGRGFYHDHLWPALVALAIFTAAIAVLGYMLNHREKTLKAESVPQEGRTHSKHVFFSIPVEFWAVIVPLLFLVDLQLSSKQKAQDLVYLAEPVRNDKYVVDFAKIFERSDGEFKYGILKVSDVKDNAVELRFSEVAYKSQFGPNTDIRVGKAEYKDYFHQESVLMDKEELIKLKEDNAIFSVSRR